MNDPIVAGIVRKLYGDDPTDWPDGEPEEPERCEAFAKRGTGTGVCDGIIVNGVCTRAGRHIDA